MSSFGLSCDVCNRENVGITWVNGMKFCAKCYQETFGNNTDKFADLLNSEMYELKISNLEHKLNEKDQRIAELEEELKKSQNQKAIEELEKLKSAILSERNTTYFKFDNFNKGKDTAYYWANEIIDNQIKKLKGEE